MEIAERAASFEDNCCVLPSRQLFPAMNTVDSVHGYSHFVRYCPTGKSAGESGFQVSPLALASTYRQVRWHFRAYTDGYPQMEAIYTGMLDSDVYSINQEAFPKSIKDNCTFYVPRGFLARYNKIEIPIENFGVTE